MKNARTPKRSLCATPQPRGGSQGAWLTGPEAGCPGRARAGTPVAASEGGRVCPAAQQERGRSSVVVSPVSVTLRKPTAGPGPLSSIIGDRRRPGMGIGAADPVPGPTGLDARGQAAVPFEAGRLGGLLQAFFCVAVYKAILPSRVYTYTVVAVFQSLGRRGEFKVFPLGPGPVVFRRRDHPVDEDPIKSSKVWAGPPSARRPRHHVLFCSVHGEHGSPI